MHHPTDTHRTANDLSPEELAEYSRRLEQHLRNREVDEALLQRAWQTAHRVAAMLYEILVQHRSLSLDRLLSEIGFQSGQILILPSGAFRVIRISTRCGKPETSVQNSKSISLISTARKDDFASRFKAKPFRFNGKKRILTTNLAVR